MDYHQSSFCNILNGIVDDVVASQCIEIAHSITYKRLGCEYISLHLQSLVIREISIEQLVTFFQGYEYRSAIHRLIQMELVERPVLSQSIVIAPTEESTNLAEVVDKGILSTWLWRTLFGCLLEKLWIVITIDVLVLRILPNVMQHGIVHIIYI